MSISMSAIHEPLTREPVGYPSERDALGGGINITPPPHGYLRNEAP